MRMESGTGTWGGWIGALALCALVVAAAPGNARAQQEDSARIAELERRVDAVTRELERMRLGRDVVEADTSILGLGPAASKVYKVNQGVSIGGYGEVLYENYADERQDGVPSDRTDQLDALRAILYVGYKFNDRWLFNSEIEVEHADEIYLEFAYLDYLFSDVAGMRAGMLLAPMGLVNELHEPPVFLGTERSLTESVIIPSTWRENGVGLFGGFGPLVWRGYVMNGLNAAGFGAAGLRGGRQKGARALAEDFGVAGRLDYVGLLGLTAGASAYYGQSGQGIELGGDELGVGTLIWDAHLDYEIGGLDLRALVAGARLDDAAELNQVLGLAGAAGVGDELFGWYAQAGYDVLRALETRHQLIPYARYEQVNTHASVPDGYVADPARDQTVLSVGVAWKPLTNVVWKADYQIHSNEADTAVDQLNVALGWLF